MLEILLLIETGELIVHSHHGCGLIQVEEVPGFSKEALTKGFFSSLYTRFNIPPPKHEVFRIESLDIGIPHRHVVLVSGTVELMHLLRKPCVHGELKVFTPEQFEDERLSHITREALELTEAKRRCC